MADTPLGFEYLKGKNYGAGLIFGETAKPAETADIIVKEIENTALYGLKNADTVIKKQRGELTMQTESLNGAVMFAADCFAKDIDFLDIFELYDKIDIGSLKVLPEDIALSVVKGEKQAE